jgi:3-phenylpropionate/cinnamic acid dioxygenase small subunit
VTNPSTTASSERAHFEGPTSGEGVAGAPAPAVMSLEEEMKLSHLCTRFVNKEAELLDSQEYQTWVTMLSREIDYRVPVRVTRERGKPQFSDDYHYYDTWESLNTRAQRLDVKHAYAENPASRTVRLVSNVRLETVEENLIGFRSNFMIYRGFWEDPSFDLICGERRDVIRAEEDEWRLYRRLVHLAHTSINSRNLALLL